MAQKEGHIICLFAFCSERLLAVGQEHYERLFKGKAIIRGVRNGCRFMKLPKMCQLGIGSQFV